MKRILWVGLLLSVLANGFLLYRLLDTGVTATYGAAEMRYREKQITAAEKILPSLVANISREALLAAAHKSGLEILDKGQDGLYVGSVQFIFSDNRVSAVKFN